MPEDRSGKKVNRHIECYLPDTTRGASQVWAWPDTERKKHFIHNEYQEQKASGADLNLDTGFPLIAANTDAETMKTLTAHMKLYHSMEEAGTLNFGGRVSKPSRKNFQLVHSAHVTGG